MQPIQFFAARAEDGVLLPAATVDVYLAGTTTRAPLYSDGAATVALGNPTYADGSARVFFYTPTERIDIHISRAGYIAPPLLDVVTTDPNDVLATMNEVAAAASAEMDAKLVAGAGLVVQAEAAAEAAEGARDAAQLSAGIYPDTATGIGAVADGEYFNVPGGSSNESILLYRREGATATLIKTYPSAGYIDSVAAASASSPRYATAAGTNDLVITSATAVADAPYQRLVFIAPATNTGAMTINVGGISRTLQSQSGGAVASGDVLQGRWYEVMYLPAPSNVWRIVNAGDTLARLAELAGGVVTVDPSSTANAIVLTGRYTPAAAGGMIISFRTTQDNTGAVTISFNGSVRSLLRASGGPLLAGDIKTYQPVVAQYMGSPGNTWRLISNGYIPRSEIDNINSTLEALEEEVDALSGDSAVSLRTDPLEPLRSVIRSDAFGEVSWSAGVRTVTPLRIVVSSVGSSVGTGAGASAAYAPGQLLVDALNAELDGYGNIEFVLDNQSVGGQTISQFAAQLAASTEATKHILLIVGGMNDGFVANYNSGQTFTGAKSAFDSLVSGAVADGSLVIVATSPHPHPDRYTVSISSSLPMYYPYRTYNVTVPYTFSTVDNSISAPQLANASYGGQILNPGDRVRVASGSNAGTYTISSISGDRQTLFVTEPLVASVTESVLVQHLYIDSETVLMPAASVSKLSRDWVGDGGASAVGDVRFWEINNMMRDVAVRNGAMIADAERSFFEGLRSYTYDDFYDNPNYNHPSVLGYEQSYGVALEQIARDIARQVISQQI